MRKIALFLGMLYAASLPLSAATRTDVAILEAVENIRYISQAISKDYMYLLANPQKTETREKVRTELDELIRNIRTISTSTNDQDTKNVLEFLVYSKNQMEEVISGNPSKEKAALLLDYSETLLEGAKSIGEAHKYEFAESERMLMRTKKIQYLLERSAKFYMAFGVGLDSPVYEQQFTESIQQIDAELTTLMNHSYPGDMEKQEALLNKYWSSVQKFYNKKDEFFTPGLVVLVGQGTEGVLEEFAQYHKRVK